jgi:hypothetical protein
MKYSSIDIQQDFVVVHVSMHRAIFMVDPARGQCGREQGAEKSVLGLL